MVAEALKPDEIRKMMESSGLRVEEKKSIQKTLDGKSLGYHTLTGYKEGAYKITVRLTPRPQTIHFVVSTRSNAAAENLADKLDEELGITSDVDEETVRGQSRNVTRVVIKRLIELAEEASRR